MTGKQKKKLQEKKAKEPTLSVNFLADKREERFRKGLWQFFIDHARLLPDGNYQIVIFAKTETELWRRAEARMAGTYKVNDEEKMKQKKSVGEMHILKRERDRIKKAGEKIYKENLLIGKIVHKVYFLSRKYLMKVSL